MEHRTSLAACTELLGTTCLFIYKTDNILFIWFIGSLRIICLFSNQSGAVIIQNSAQHLISNFTASYFQNFFFFDMKCPPARVGEKDYGNLPWL